jgi:hypothetical protein
MDLLCAASESFVSLLVMVFLRPYSPQRQRETKVAQSCKPIWTLPVATKPYRKNKVDLLFGVRWEAFNVNVNLALHL